MTYKKTRVELLVGTGNAGKLREFSELLAPLPISPRSLKDFPDVREVAETGASFEENAALKAAGYAGQTGLWTLADDSGLEVAALGGAPGVRSARFAGEQAGDAENNQKLVYELRKNHESDSSARFVCAIALAAPDGTIKTVVTGDCHGRVTAKPRGINGFGYDSLFLPEGFEQTFGELPPVVKSQISHRARALAQIKLILPRFFDF